MCLMGWRYRFGLGLIGTFVFIWVGTAEVTQVSSLLSFPFTLFHELSPNFVLISSLSYFVIYLHYVSFIRGCVASY